jgi:cyclic-di-GMP phosphodiesterase, flagellum assembly factor TipF
MSLMMQTPPDADFALTPLWRDAVVGSSITALAAAVGLGVYAEVGVAPWLATVTGLCAAGGFIALHRWMDQAPKVRRPVTRRPAVRRPEPALVSPFGPPPNDKPMPATARVSDGPAVAQPLPQTTAPVAAERALPAAPVDADFERLQALVKVMAAGVEGPKAMVPDPDAVPLRAQLAPEPVRARIEPRLPLTVGFAPVNPAATPLGLRVAEAVASGRMDVLLEPIQGLADKRPRHFEVSARFRDCDGVVLAQADVAAIARATGLSGTIDALKLPRVARVARRVQARGGAPSDVLADFAGVSLTDHEVMEAVASAFADGVPTPVVLAFSQADARAFARVHWTALAALGDMGLRFALTEVMDLDMDFELLRARGFVFVKLDAGVFLGGLPMGSSVVPAQDLARHLSGLGLSLIVGRIDDQQQLDQVLGLGAVLGQGGLFGTAKPVRQDIVGG